MKKTVIFYGDSNTYGYDPADYTEGRLPREKRWTYLAAETLGEGFQVIAEGLNGRRIPDLSLNQAWLLRLIGEAGSDGLFCTMLGTNDIGSGAEPDHRRAAQKMEAYLGFLKRRLSPEQILIIAPPCMGSPGGSEPLFRRYYEECLRMNDAFRRLCRREGVFFADAAEWGIELCYDLVHFSEAGHRRFAGKIAETVRGLTE